MGGRYKKGSDFERTIVQEFLARDWVAFRAAGSGKSDRKLPDVVAVKVGRIIIIECKATKADRISLKPAILCLAEYAAKAGGQAYMAVRFFRQRPRFYDVRDLLKRDSYTISDKDEFQSLETVLDGQKTL
jgi:Holliday junction resolvase